MLKIVNKKSSDSTKNKTEKVKERESKITGLNLDDGAKKKASKKTNKQKGKRENSDLQKIFFGYDEENIEKIRKKILIIQKPEKKS